MYTLLKLNLARSSLRYIIRNYNIQKLHLPYYLCNVVRLSVLKEDCKCCFYHIDDNFLPVKNFPTEEYILYPNYFGICDNNVKFLSKKYPKLIVDNAHSFYSSPSGFACFNSSRKFLKVYNGSYLWIKNPKLIFDYDNELNSYPDSELEMINNENKFNRDDIKFIKSDLQLNVDNIQKRKEIFLKYHYKYSKKNLLNIDINSAYSPFCYPYLTQTKKEADDLVELLENNNIKIYRYWNNLPKNYNEYKFYERLVAIPLI